MNKINYSKKMNNNFYKKIKYQISKTICSSKIMNNGNQKIKKMQRTLKKKNQSYRILMK